MEKLLNMTRRQLLAVSWGAVALGIAGILTVGLATADHVRQANQVFTTKSDTPADTIRSEQPAKPTQAAQESAQSTKAPTQPTTPIAQPRQAETKPQPSATAATPQPRVNVPATPIKDTVQAVTGLISDTLNCQYPTRPLVNGSCDNSDPCDPTTIKDPVLHGDCRN